MFRIERTKLEHEGGSKDYHLILVENEATKKCALIKRWGKIGTAGQVQSHFGDFGGMLRQLKKTQNDKVRRGYHVEGESVENPRGEGELRAVLGPLYSRLDHEALRHILDGAPTTPPPMPSAPPPDAEQKATPLDRGADWGTW